ncbi:hypothetical protein HPB50_007292 [Hyalomma asiaticum]|uniref:Uncharacterized protein n=1 Tax=Hyalomma asiaticum TaxID=266040 RepID=A0ACB7RKR8_HYAAI|nr:hypothetical protein HPB50_007292 [Hyalomma asiaticum]
MEDELKPAGIAAILLKCVPLGVIVFFGAAQTARNNFPPVPRGPYWTLLDAAQMVLLLVSTGLSVTKGCFALSYLKKDDYVSIFALREAVSDYAMALSLMRCLPPSAFAVALLGLLSTGCVLDAFLEFTTAFRLQDVTLSAVGLRKKSVIVVFVTAAAVIGNFLLSEVRDLVIKRPKHTRRSVDQDTQSVFGRRVCTVLFR